MKHLHTLLILLLSMLNLSAQSVSYTQNEIEEDLIFLSKKLQKTHPSIYLHYNPSGLEAHRKSITLKDQYNDHEAYTVISSFASIIKDGHTLFYPSKTTQQKNNESGKFFPFSVSWDAETMMVSNHYNHEEIKTGYEILAINDVLIEELLPFMIQHMMQDGNNQQYPIWVINQYFFEYYSYLFGCQEDYQITYSFNDEVYISSIPGITKTKWIENITSQEEQAKAIYYSFDQSSKLAFLTIRDWHNAVLRKRYKQSFKKEIDAFFQEAKQNKIDKLIIDLRDNQGGDLVNSKHLLSYLLDAPFTLVEAYKKRKKGILKKTSGLQQGTHKPNNYVYEGELYVLINGGSFSNTGIFCSALKSSYRATFIGEETGGSSYVFCGNPKRVRLPNTKIIIDIPKLQFVLQAFDETEELTGIIPHYVFKPTIVGLANGEDEMTEFVLRELIHNPN